MTKTCKVLGVKEELDILDVVIKIQDQCEWKENGWAVVGASVNTSGVLTLRIKDMKTKYKGPGYVQIRRIGLHDLPYYNFKGTLVWVKDGNIPKLLVL